MWRVLKRCQTKTGHHVSGATLQAQVLNQGVLGECRRVVTENFVFFALSTLTQPNRRAIICDSPMLEGAQTSAVDRQSRCAQRRQTSQVKPRRAPHTKNQKQCVGCSRWTGHLDTPPATQTSRRHGLHNNGTHTRTQHWVAPQRNMCGSCQRMPCGSSEGATERNN